MAFFICLNSVFEFYFAFCLFVAVLSLYSYCSQDISQFSCFRFSPKLTFCRYSISCLARQCAPCGAYYFNSEAYINCQSFRIRSLAIHDPISACFLPAVRRARARQCVALNVKATRAASSLTDLQGDDCTPAEQRPNGSPQPERSGPTNAVCSDRASSRRARQRLPTNPHRVWRVLEGELGDLLHPQMCLPPAPTEQKCADRQHSATVAQGRAKDGGSIFNIIDCRKS